MNAENCEVNPRAKIQMHIEHVGWLAPPRLQVTAESLHKDIQEGKAQTVGCARKQFEKVRKKVCLERCVVALGAVPVNEWKGCGSAPDGGTRLLECHSSLEGCAWEIVIFLVWRRPADSALLCQVLAQQ